MEIQEQVTLAPYTTFGIGGPARYFVEARTQADVTEALHWAETQQLPVFVLGGGSNLLVPDEGYDGLVVCVRIRGRAYAGNNIFRVGAGENWDDFVDEAVDKRFAGIECLAGIPGSTGGTPVQNVGAYGQEVSQTIVQVEAFDRMTRCFVRFDRAGCRFRYRESRFNTDEPNRYVVTRVDFELRADGKPTLTYADLKKRFESARTPPSLRETAAAVRDIRQSKGMLLVAGDANCRSAGSFFKNPIVSEDRLASISAAAGIEVPHWPAAPERTKLPAAWLLEHAGFVKGFGTGPVGISSRHTLALMNRGGARFADVMGMQAEIVDGVERKFGVRLEREPVVMA